MQNRLYERITFIALTLSALILFLLYKADRITEWKVAVCSMCGAMLSVSQVAFDLHERFLLELNTNTPSKNDALTLRRLKHSGIVLHLLGLIIFIAGLAVEADSIPTKDNNLMTLLSFVFIFLSMTIKSFDNGPIFQRENTKRGKHESIRSR